MPKMSSKAERNAIGELFRADQDVLQAAEALGRAAAHVRLKESWRGDEERDAVLRDEFADDLGSRADWDGRRRRSRWQQASRGRP